MPYFLAAAMLAPGNAAQGQHIPTTFPPGPWSCSWMPPTTMHGSAHAVKPNVAPPGSPHRFIRPVRNSVFAFITGISAIPYADGRLARPDDMEYALE